MTTSLIREPLDDEQTKQIIGAAIEVHRKMGRGFLEPVYCGCLAIEFLRRSIPFLREALLSVSYDGILLPVHYRVDFVCYESVIVEVKALASLTSRETAQAMNYLKASGLHRALLLNFGANVLEKRRFVWDLPEGQDPVRQTTKA